MLTTIKTKHNVSEAGFRPLHDYNQANGSFPRAGRAARRVSLLAAVAALAALAPAGAWAAGAEVTAQGGGLFLSGGNGTHGMFGGTVAVTTQSGFDVFFEASGARIASLSVSGGGVSASGSADLADFGGGIAYNFGKSKRVLPYALTSVGVGHSWISATASSGGQTASSSESLGNSPYVTFGGGVRIFIGSHWGFKPEARFQRFTNTNFGLSSAGQVTIGLFWRSGGD